jgi:uncharacterized protein
MHPDVQSLLTVQRDDLVLYALEDRLAALAPRLAALERERGKVSSQLDAARAEVAAEEARHRDALNKLETHRALLERSQRAYESVTTPKEANAANVQLEQTRRMVADSEQEDATILERIGQHRHRVAELEASLAEVESRQAETRTALDTERKEIEAEIAAAKAERESKARAVPRPLLSKYERVRVRRRNESVFPLRGQSCSACDTAVPMQRRSGMANAGALEMCEGCGVLLYAGE